jgi:hypothetical protein
LPNANTQRKPCIPLSLSETITMNLDSDSAFLSLLSSQRELLNQLSMDSSVCKTSQNTSPSEKKGQSDGLGNSRSMKNCTNQPITERRSSLDTITSKRFSLGFGSDPLSFSFHDAKTDMVFSAHKDLADLVGSKRSCLDDLKSDEGVKRRKKRRMSSMGFFSPMFFDDDEFKSSRRSSIAFGCDENDPVVEEQEEEQEDVPTEIKEELPEVADETEYAVVKKEVEHDSKSDAEEEDDEDDASTGSVSVRPVKLDAPRLDPVKFRTTMEAFHDAMGMSQTSQQDIHDWDRKMGLKRSHSKTMRLSSRSRKKLKAIMKKEINSMALKC